MAVCRGRRLGGGGGAALVKLLNHWSPEPSCSKAAVTGMESRKHIGGGIDRTF